MTTYVIRGSLWITADEPEDALRLLGQQLIDVAEGRAAHINDNEAVLEGQLTCSWSTEEDEDDEQGPAEDRR